MSECVAISVSVSTYVSPFATCVWIFTYAGMCDFVSVGLSVCVNVSL